MERWRTFTHLILMRTFVSTGTARPGMHNQSGEILCQCYDCIKIYSKGEGKGETVLRSKGKVYRKEAHEELSIFEEVEHRRVILEDFSNQFLR